MVAAGNPQQWPARMKVVKLGSTKVNKKEKKRIKLKHK
jgi:hypothetical protein